MPDTAQERVARAMSAQTHGDGYWLHMPARAREGWLSDAAAALAVVRAICLEHVAEIRGRAHLTDSGAECEAREQRALVAWQLAEMFNTEKGGSDGE